jgi:hypothetical protein
MQSRGHMLLLLQAHVSLPQWQQQQQRTAAAAMVGSGVKLRSLQQSG